MGDVAGGVLPAMRSRTGVAAMAWRLRAAWRGVTWARCAWTFGLGTVGGLLFVLSHGLRKVQALLEHQASLANTLTESGVAIATTIAAAFLFLLALNVAEYGDRGQPRACLRYVIATLVAVGGSTVLVHALAPLVPIAALVGWYPLEEQSAVDSFVFSNWLLFGGLAVFVYVWLRRARQGQAAFERAELDRVATRRGVLTAQLAAAQAQVEPRFLFNTLHQVEAKYAHDAASGERMLDDLIAYLRAALPQLRGEESTLARECELAGAYLRIAQARMGSRLEFSLDIPSALGARHFPPMLLLPLVESSVRDGLEPLPHGGRIEIRATLRDDRLQLAVADNGLRDASALRASRGLDTLRERLAELYGGGAALTIHADQPCGMTATVEIPLA